jgi:type IV pilus assembly protein PilA
MKNKFYWRFLISFGTRDPGCCERSIRSQSEGFTLVELLVVIIIVGILAAIAIPNFLNQAVKARQSEAKQNVALVNRAQSQYRTEYSTFANSFDILAVGAGLSGGNSVQTGNYIYTLNDGITDLGSTGRIKAQSLDVAVKPYTGGLLRYTSADNKTTLATVICESTVPAGGVPANVNFSANSVDCPNDYQVIRSNGS